MALGFTVVVIENYVWPMTRLSLFCLVVPMLSTTRDRSKNESVANALCEANWAVCYGYEGPRSVYGTIWIPMLCYLVGNASMFVGSYDQARKVKRSKQ